MSDVTDKLISSAELIAYASNFSVWGWSTEDHEKFLDKVQWCVDSTPPATDLVYCKDCILQETPECQIQNAYYGLGDYDYCSYGRRINDGKS